MGSNRSRLAGAFALLLSALTAAALAFPVASQEAAAPILFLSDQHGDTLCEQQWFDIYELTAESAQPGVSIGASIGGGVARLLQALPAQEAGARRITDARAQTPDAEAYCTIGYGRPVMSPDGSLIAATRREGSSQSLVVMNRDGSEQRVVAYPDESHVTSASWSPDGQRLVHDGHDVPGLKIVSIDGSEATLIPNTQFFSDPAWSHDGAWIAFVFTPQQDNPRQRPAIGVIAPDGTGFRQVTLDPDIAAASRPAWSPDDSEIAFSTENPGCGGTRVSIVPFEGAADFETLPLPADMCRSGGPAWLSATRIAFWSAVGTDEPDLYAVDRGDAGSLVRLTDTPGVELDPSIALGASAAPGPDVGLPGTGNGDEEPAPGDVVVDDSTAAASRAPLIAGAVVALVAAGLVASRTVFATAGARARRARSRERERDRSSDHATCETRWDSAAEHARTARTDTGAALDRSMHEASNAWRELSDSLEQARAAFDDIAPSEPVQPRQDDEAAVVERLLASIAAMTEEDPAR